MTQNEQKVYDFFNEYPGHLKTAKRDIANRLGVQPNDIDNVKQYLREDKVPSYTEYDQFIEERGINPDNVSMIWHKGQGYSVMERNPEPELDQEKLFEFLKGYEYEGSIPSKHRYPNENSVAVFNIFDAHIDKLSYVGNGGLEEVTENLDYLLEHSKSLLAELLIHQPGLVILPIGNDFFNTNGSLPETKRGTPQSMTISWQDSFQLGVEFYRTLIDMISEYTTVKVINIPGNHDFDKVFYLGEVIKALYKDKDNVELDLSKHTRKYVHSFNVLFGFGHGKVEKRRLKDLPTAMALEQPKLWGQAEHKTWILGDRHHKEEFNSLHSLEHNGVEIKFLRAACGDDEWHNNSMWLGAKKSISYILYKNNGKRYIQDEIFI